MSKLHWTINFALLIYASLTVFLAWMSSRSLLSVPFVFFELQTLLCLLAGIGSLVGIFLSKEWRLPFLYYALYFTALFLLNGAVLLEYAAAV